MGPLQSAVPSDSPVAKQEYKYIQLVWELQSTKESIFFSLRFVSDVKMVTLQQTRAAKLRTVGRKGSRPVFLNLCETADR